MTIITGASGLIGRKVCKWFEYENKPYFPVDFPLYDLCNKYHIKDAFKIKVTSILLLHGKNDHVTKNRKETELDTDSMIDYFNVNMYSQIACIQEFMKNNRHGNVVLFGSLYSVVSPSPEISKNKDIGYVATKTAIPGITKYLAVNYPNYLFNCISVGGIKHEQSNEFIKAYNKRTPLNRMADISDLYGALDFLLFNNSYMTGQNLVIDGGYSSC
jgi:NAD(P)-dependent dehydrogenase (short-subunit alcohol dehydrogenase family)